MNCMLNWRKPCVTLLSGKPCPHCGGTGFIAAKYDAGALVAALADRFGEKTAFSAADAVRLGLEPALASPKRCGQALRALAKDGTAFAGCIVERIGGDRDGAIWWIARV
jgi:hypothetical protein